MLFTIVVIGTIYTMATLDPTGLRHVYLVWRGSLTRAVESFGLRSIASLDSTAVLLRLHTS